jgi:hypothetical protein
LVASHKATILAVAEMGGTKVWMNFFKKYKGAIDDLRVMQALPSADVIALPHPSTRRRK